MMMWDKTIKYCYSSKGEKTGFREASLEVLKCIPNCVDLTMIHQCVIAELVSTQKDLPANKELPPKTGRIRSGNLRDKVSSLPCYPLD